MSVSPQLWSWYPVPLRVRVSPSTVSVAVTLPCGTEGSQAKVMQALELGANGYVRKPFTAEQIKEKLAGIL